MCLDEARCIRGVGLLKQARKPNINATYASGVLIIFVVSRTKYNKMKIAPFNTIEAGTLADKFQYLPWKEFIDPENNKTYTILLVGLIPYDQKDQMELMSLYFRIFNKLEGFPKNAATEYLKNYTKDEYDVAIIAGVKENGGVSLKTLPLQIISTGNSLVHGFNVEIQEPKNDLG